MNTCDGCEHWHNPWDDEHDETWLVGRDEVPRWGTCRIIGLHDQDEGYASVTLPAFTLDGSDYKADLHTRADFGCTLWESSEDPSTSGPEACRHLGGLSVGWSDGVMVTARCMVCNADISAQIQAGW